MSAACVLTLVTASCSLRTTEGEVVLDVDVELAPNGAGILVSGEGRVCDETLDVEADVDEATGTITLSSSGSVSDNRDEACGT